MKDRGRFSFLCLAAFGLLYLPFLGQAFHIDDRIYLEIAGNILEKPLFPYDYAPEFEGLRSPDAASHSHLPLTAYYLALLKLLVGSETEWFFHLAFLLFPIAGAWAFLDLARRFTRSPVVAAALLLAAPAFCILGHTLMPDVPFLCLWLVSLAGFFRVADGSRSLSDWGLFLGGLLGASFISLLALGLPLLMGAHLKLHRKAGDRSVRKILAIALAVPFLLWTGWYLFAYLHYGRFVLLNTLLHMGKRQALDGVLLGTKALSFVLNIGAAFLCPIALWYAFSGALRTRVASLVFLFSFVPFYSWVDGWSWGQSFLFAAFLASGLLVIWQFILVARQGGPENGFLLLWFLGALFIALFAYYSGSVRYVLLALPPVLLAWIRELERKVRETYFLRNLLWTGVALTAAYTLPLAVTDFKVASVYRETAVTLVNEYAGEGRTIWFTGEWGLRYYLERAGARMLLRTGQGAEIDDIIIKPFVASPWVTLYDGDRFTRLVEQREAKLDSPLRLLDFSSRAGFYSTGWGLLPFALDSGERWEWFNVFRVVDTYSGPVPEAEQHW